MPRTRKRIEESVNHSHRTFRSSFLGGLHPRDTKNYTHKMRVESFGKPNGQRLSVSAVRVKRTRTSVQERTGEAGAAESQEPQVCGKMERTTVPADCSVGGRDFLNPEPQKGPTSRATPCGLHVSLTKRIGQEHDRYTPGCQSSLLGRIKALKGTCVLRRLEACCAGSSRYSAPSSSSLGSRETPSRVHPTFAALTGSVWLGGQAYENRCTFSKTIGTMTRACGADEGIIPTNELTPCGEPPIGGPMPTEPHTPQKTLQQLRGIQ